MQLFILHLHWRSSISEDCGVVTETVEAPDAWEAEFEARHRWVLRSFGTRQVLYKILDTIDPLYLRETVAP